ncbi:MAG TPA: 4-hydroxythreonine-4-phosphate dehydrogenase, partial [Roseiarcus sp.]|nr:4-hydroxythreonine-4-phosphate dehydrogenase [Roseiarcus sp.]
MDFVFMLTRNDATVENALDLVEIARPLSLKHIGFKDVGADAALLRRLTAAIREAGASPWMEIVATTRETELRGVKLGRDLGVEMLMGGVHVEEALRILDGSATRYLPFAGAPIGHPTRLGGSALAVEAQCRTF